MSIRDKRLRARRTRSQIGRASGPIPRSSRARRHVKLSMRRRRQVVSEPQVEVASLEPDRVDAVAVKPDRVDASGLGPQPLSELTGVTPTMERRLHAMGQTRYFQMAHWSQATVVEVAKQLGCEPQRILASNWIGQARGRG